MIKFGVISKGYYSTHRDASAFDISVFTDVKSTCITCPLTPEVRATFAHLSSLWAGEDNWLNKHDIPTQGHCLS